MSKLILHIDDEQPIREMVYELLSSSGYRVRSVATPTEAVRAMHEEAPALIISDLQLDEADGLQTIAQLQQIRANTPVILLTGVLIDPVVARKTLGRHVNAYLEKTRPIADIVAEVTRLIGSAD